MKHISFSANTRLALYAALTLCVVYAVHGYCRMYFDDYAYAGLTYFYTTPGTYDVRFTLWNFFHYLYEHYMGWGGRVVPFAFAIPLLHAGADYFWIAQTAVVSAILLFSALLARKLARDSSLLIYFLAVLLAYFTIPASAARDGLYWASASSAYVWPAVCFLSAMLLLQDGPMPAGRTAGITLLLLLASASAEMYAVITLGTIGSMFFLKWCFTKKFDKSLFFFCLVALAGFSFMILAPGNFARALIQNAQRPDLMGMFQILINDFPNIYSELLYPAGRLHFIFALSLCAVFYNAVMLFVKKDTSAIAATSMSFGFLAAFSIFLIPEARGGRMYLPLFLLAPVIAAPLLATVRRCIGVRLTVVVLAVLLINPTQSYIQIYKGYKANYPAIVASDKNMENYRPGDTSLDFYILPDDTYAPFMPYHKPVRFIEAFMRSRYDIPHSVQFVYNDNYVPEDRKGHITGVNTALHLADLQKNCELTGWALTEWGLWAETTNPEITLLTKAPAKSLELELVGFTSPEKDLQQIEVYIDHNLVFKKDNLHVIVDHVTISIPEEAQKKLAQTGRLTLKFHLPAVSAVPWADLPPGTQPVGVGLRSLLLHPAQ